MIAQIWRPFGFNRTADREPTYVRHQGTCQEEILKCCPCHLRIDDRYLQKASTTPSPCPLARSIFPLPLLLLHLSASPFPSSPQLAPILPELLLERTLFCLAI